MIFSSNTAGYRNALSVDGGRFDVYVATINPLGDPTADPTWLPWRKSANLKFEEAFYGSSIAGMSHAKVSLANGVPIAGGVGNVDIEKDTTLSVGDRVCIVCVVGQIQTPLFAGYCTGGKIGISPEAETLHFHIAGPEWLWGGGGIAGGSFSPVAGQVRRKGPEDDDWLKNQGPPAAITKADGIYLFTTDRCVFNPGGRRNMAVDDVHLFDDSEPGSGVEASAATLGRVWESPERLVEGNAVTDFWTVLQAAKTLELYWNISDTTGIADPDWSKSGIDASKTIGQIDVDGEGLWDALKKVCTPEYGFFVDPRPASMPTGTSWGPFKLRFFQRGVDIDGAGSQVNVYLNKRGTTAANAVASVTRLQAAKSIEKTVTRCDVWARFARHIKLQYQGGKTPTLGGIPLQLMLQHGWTKADLDWSDYTPDEDFSDLNPDAVGETIGDQWRDRYTTAGKNFLAYKHAGRLFCWNEARELYSSSSDETDLPEYAGTSFTWVAPDLTGIADGEGPDAGKFCRRPRKLLDTLYGEAGQLDGWRKVPPTLFISALAPDSDAQSIWLRVPTSHYRIDPERAAVWITAPDLLAWSPLTNVSFGGSSIANDDRSFAELLATGKLRLLLEATIETDCVYGARADRQAVAGSPFVRRVIVRGERDFIKTEIFADSVTSPTGLTGEALDTTDDAQTLANQYRDAGQDQATHASILVAADWPLQGIGKVLNQIQGRTVNLTGGLSGRGSQIVALQLDPVAYKVELLNESAALRLRAQDRRKLATAGRGPVNVMPGAGANAADVGLRTGSPVGEATA